MRKLFRFHIKALSLLARLRLLNVLSARLRRLYPRRLDIIFDLKSELFVVTLLALVTGGCMMGPDYRRPSVDMPQSFQYEAKEAAEAADTEWWKAFQDPVLDGLIAEALANNKSVKIAAANIEQAAGVLTQTRAPLFPQANYNGSAGRERFSQSLVRRSRPVSRTRTISSRYSPAQAGRSTCGDGSDVSPRRPGLSCLPPRRRDAAQSFPSLPRWQAPTCSCVASMSSWTLPNAASAPMTQSVKLYELQFQYGLVSQMIVEQARTQYETAAATIPQLESQIVQNENALSILLGRNPGPIARGKTFNEMAFPAVPAGLPSQLLERRPDLAQAEQNLIAANARIGAAKALYFPTISLTGSYGYASTHLSDLFNSPSRAWSYAGSFTGPIFTAGAISGQVNQSEAAQKAALIGYEAAIQSAFADVENALIIREKLVGQIEAQERLVKANQEYERLAKMQYDEGYAPYLTVLNAQQQLFPSELNLAQLRASLFTSYANLYKAMGGGWVTAADRLTVPAGGQPPGTQQVKDRGK